MRSAIIAGMGTLSRADVEHVAHLARLGLADDELARLEGELNHILDQYAILARLDTDAIPPTAQTIELENILRDDVAAALAGGRRGARQRSRARRRPRRRAGDPRRRAEATGDAPTADRPPLTRLAAHEMAAAPARRRGLVARADARPTSPRPRPATARSTPGSPSTATGALAAAEPPTPGSPPPGPSGPGRPRRAPPAVRRARSASRTLSRSAASSAPPARGSSPATSRPSTRTSPSASAPPGR